MLYKEQIYVVPMVIFTLIADIKITVSVVSRHDLMSFDS